MKWYMHNPASVLEKDIHKLLLDLDIETDNQISDRRPDLIIINKKKENLQNCGLCCPGDLRRLAVTQTPVKNRQLKLMGKTLKE